MASIKRYAVKLSFCFLILISCKKTEVKGDITYSIGNVFSASFNYTLPANNYTWDFGDNNYSNLAIPVHRYKYGGLYHVKLQADNQVIEKDIRIATPDTLKITSFTIRKTPFRFVDSNQLYNIYWKSLNERTGETFRSRVIFGVTQSNLPISWDNTSVNIPISNLQDRYYLKIGFYQQADNSFHDVAGYSFTYNYLFGYYGYSDTLYLGDTPFSDCQFDFSTQWIAN